MTLSESEYKTLIKHKEVELRPSSWILPLRFRGFWLRFSKNQHKKEQGGRLPARTLLRFVKMRARRDDNPLPMTVNQAVQMAR